MWSTRRARSAGSWRSRLPAVVPDAASCVRRLRKRTHSRWTPACVSVGAVGVVSPKTATTRRSASRSGSDSPQSLRSQRGRSSATRPLLELAVPASAALALLLPALLLELAVVTSAAAAAHGASGGATSPSQISLRRFLWPWWFRRIHDRHLSSSRTSVGCKTLRRRSAAAPRIVCADARSRSLAAFCDT